MEPQQASYYFVTHSGMGGAVVYDEESAALYRALPGWEEVTEAEFDRIITSASYDMGGMGYSE